MLHAHGVAGLLGRRLAVDALGYLHAVNFNGVCAEGGVDGHRAAHTDGDAVVLAALEGEHLAEAAHVEPGLAGDARVLVPVLCLEFLDVLGALLERVEAIRGAVIRLHKDALAHVHHAVADFALEADVGDLAVPVVGLARAVAVKRVAVGVGMVDGYHEGKVYLVLKS